jgi:REP-associated tyrosine transposase
VQALGEACGMTGWRVHAWVLLGNHYHLMIETPEANLVAWMKWLQNTLTRRFKVSRRAALHLRSCCLRIHRRRSRRRLRDSR